MKARNLALATAFGALTAAAQAQVLLNIDVTNPNAVSITSTGAAAAASSSGAGFRLELRNFFTNPDTANTGWFPSGNLASNVTYAFVSTLPSSRNLYLLSFPLNGVQTFTAGQTAFTGAATSSFSSTNGGLPTNAATGDIIVVDSNNQPTGVTIGQYRVTAVPEPGTLTVLALGAAALLRRKRAKTA